LRERGCMPADTFVLIFKCVARPNLCETPALAKPPPRCAKCRATARCAGGFSANLDSVQKISNFGNLGQWTLKFLKYQ